MARLWCLVEFGLLRDVEGQIMVMTPLFLESATCGGMGNTRFVGRVVIGGS